MFKDLQKLIQQSQQQRDSNNEIFTRLQNKPFWIWDIEEHKQEYIDTKGDCCFSLRTNNFHEVPLSSNFFLVI
jgi:hypothetical protein